MRKISTWGRKHPWSARLVIVLSFILMTALGILVGRLLLQTGFLYSTTSLIIFIGLYFTGILLYPRRGDRSGKFYNISFYVRQKSCDALLVVATFLLVVSVANQPGMFFSQPGSLYAAIPASKPVPGDSLGRTYMTGKEFSKAVRDADGKLLKWKERKKMLKTQVKSIKRSNDMSTGGKIALIVLAVILAAGLAYGVLALACSISCGGSEAAAIVVGIGGLALVALLLVIAIRAILGKKRKKKEPSVDAPGTTG